MNIRVFKASFQISVALIVFSAGVAEAAQYRITGFSAAQVPTYDEHGKARGTRPAPAVGSGVLGDSIAGSDLICLESTPDSQRTCFHESHLHTESLESEAESEPADEDDACLKPVAGAGYSDSYSGGARGASGSKCRQ